MALDQSFFQEMEARIPRGKVRTRFAPSPPAICTWAICGRPCTPGSIARHAGGTFILRIEDTDQGRPGGGRHGRNLPHHGGVRPDP